MNLTQGFHRSLQQCPDGILTIHDDRVRTVRQCADRIATFAGGLRELGVRRDDRVAVLALNSDCYTEYILGIAWADGIFNLINTRWSAQEVSYALEDSGASILVIDDAFVPMLPELRAAWPRLRTVIHSGDAPTPDDAVNYEAFVAAAEPVEDALRGGDDIAGLFYTGGTTGFPKGVALSHANLLASAIGGAATQDMVQAGGAQLHAAPMFHLADFLSWVMQIVVGGRHVSVPTFDVPAVVRAIEEHRVTATTLVPAMIQMLVDHPTTAEHDLTSLKRVLYGGSPIAESVLRRAIVALPNASFIQAYGMTEVAGIATLLSAEEHRKQAHLRSGGRAAPHTEIRVVDATDSPVPIGEVGEITVRSAGVMRSYWNLPEETSIALRDGWMHTGDAGYLDSDGYLFVVDRIKDMIISGGENIYSSEVENAISSHPDVADCAVIGLPDQQWGERVHAVVITRPGAEVSADELREHVKSLIANYKAPRSVEFVDVLPRTAAGKVQKQLLREAAAPLEIPRSSS